jgi:hypothetical protein
MARQTARFRGLIDSPSVCAKLLTHCAGTQEELEGSHPQPKTFQILSSSTGGAQTTVDFGGHCPDRSILGDACAEVPVRWSSKVLETGDARVDTGTDQVAPSTRKPSGGRASMKSGHVHLAQGAERSGGFLRSCAERYATRDLRPWTFRLTTFTLRPSTLRPCDSTTPCLFRSDACAA